MIGTYGDSNGTVPTLSAPPVYFIHSLYTLPPPFLPHLYTHLYTGGG